MTEIGIGIVGGGYMGKAHAAAMAAVGAIFGTALRPRLVSVAASGPESAARHRGALGFDRAAADWAELVSDRGVEAVIVATPQATHREIAEAAFALGKPVFCEKPVGESAEDCRRMIAAGEAAGAVHMAGFNYIRTPASQYARKLLEEGAIGRVTWFRGEHTEDFHADPAAPISWRSRGRANGAMGDLAPHILNAALALMGPVESLSARIETVHATRRGPEGPMAVDNDDQAQIMCRFASGAMGHIHVSRVATGRKMGYAYDIHGTEGAIRFDQEDQNALWLYRAEGPEAERGFRKILTGPAHPDYRAFCLGAGHGTGYQDQIVIEARDFLAAIEAGRPLWPDFRDALAVHELTEAAFASDASGAWVAPCGAD